MGAIQELGPSAADRGAGWQAGARLRSRGSLSLTRLPGGWSGGRQTATRVWLPPAPAAAGAIDQTALPTARPSGHLWNTRGCASQGAGAGGRPAGALAECSAAGSGAAVRTSSGAQYRERLQGVVGAAGAFCVGAGGPLVRGMKPPGLWWLSEGLPELDPGPVGSPAQTTRPCHMNGDCTYSESTVDSGLPGSWQGTSSDGAGLPRLQQPLEQSGGRPRTLPCPMSALHAVSLRTHGISRPWGLGDWTCKSPDELRQYGAILKMAGRPPWGSLEALAQIHQAPRKIPGLHCHPRPLLGTPPLS